MSCIKCGSNDTKKVNDRDYDITHRKVNEVCNSCGYENVIKYPIGEKVQKDQAETITAAKDMVNGEYNRVVVSGHAICRYCGNSYSPDTYAEHFNLCKELDELKTNKNAIEIQIGKKQQEIIRHDEKIREMTNITSIKIDYDGDTNSVNIYFDDEHTSSTL